MSKSIPNVEKYMTTTPISVNSDQCLADAYKIMQDHKFRHLPVLHDSNLCGIISDRDIKLALGIQGVDANKTKVQEVSNDDVFLVQPQARLDEVVRMMGERKIGSVLVVDNHRLVGIFTTTDAMKAFAELLETRLTH